MSSVQLSICVVCLDICSFICHCVGAIFLVPEVSYRFQNTLCVLTNVGEMLHCAATHNVTHSRCVRIPLSCVLLRRLNSTKYDYTYFSVNTDHVAQYAIKYAEYTPYHTFSKVCPFEERWSLSSLPPIGHRSNRGRHSIITFLLES